MKSGENYMAYKIKLFEEFLEELDEICNYISFKLKNANAANELREEIKLSISLLKQSPQIFPKIEKLSKLKMQYRKIIVSNYIILYTMDISKQTVYIAHIYYGGRNYIYDLL